MGKKLRINNIFKINNYIFSKISWYFIIFCITFFHKLKNYIRAAW